MNKEVKHHKEDIKKEEESKKCNRLKVIKHPLFVSLTFLLIIGNTIILSMTDFKNTDSKIAELDKYNEYFTWSFIIEMLIKIWAFEGIRGYARDPFNLFDGFLVFMSIIDLAIG